MANLNKCGGRLLAMYHASLVNRDGGDKEVGDNSMLDLLVDRIVSRVSEERFEVSEERFEVSEERFEVSEERFESSEERFESSESRPLDGTALHGLELDPDPRLGKRVRVMVRFTDEAVDLYDQDNWLLRRISKTIGAGVVRLSALPRLAELPIVMQISLDAMANGQGFNFPADHVGTPPPVSRCLGEVVIGVIDNAVDYQHQAFQVDGRTRIESLWAIKGEPSLSSPERANQPYNCVGIEYDAARIDEALASPNPLEIVPHAPASSGDHRLHGTQVLAVAAAGVQPCKQFTGLAPDAKLIFVAARGSGTAPIGNLSDLAYGVRYIFDKAKERPCVVNISLGDNLGPKDGSSHVELAIDEMIAERSSRMVVICAGNGRWSKTMQPKTPWSVHGISSDGCANSAKFSVWGPAREIVVELWLEPGAQFTSLRVQGLGQGFVDIDDSGYGQKVFNNGAAVLIQLASWNNAAGPSRQYVSMSLFTKGTGQGNGFWTLLFKTSRAGAKWRGAIECDEHACWNNVSCEARDPSTIMTPATGRLTMVVGAYHPSISGRRLAFYSSYGRSDDGRMLPHLCALGQGMPVPIERGGCVKDIHYKGQVGTSFAAPIVTGMLARIFASDPGADATTIGQALINCADHENLVVPTPGAGGSGCAVYPTNQ